ncbi:MAG TPA: hypothetical protein VLV45_02855 [Gemmatimonadales bacterium]|nr:hypothetical protein [Gemmatimonadales bacterium]
MLSAAPPPLSDAAAAPRGVRRPPRSLKQEYEEFMLQRIEAYKNSLSRGELLEIGDEAVRELETNAAGQYFLTEVLLLEHVDRVIARRLRLPAFPRWRQRYRNLRISQREAAHWGLDRDAPLATLARRVEPGDTVVIVGAGALAGALFLAAHDAEVLFLDQNLGAIEAAESRAVSEQLAGRFHALVIQLGGWLPDVAPDLAVIDPAALAPLAGRDRSSVITGLQMRTPPGGVHLVLPTNANPEVIPLAAETLQTQYADWEIVRRKRARRGDGFVATKPARHIDTQANVSD